MSGLAFGAPLSDDDTAESSREIIDDLRAMGAISAEEARRHVEPAPPERRIRWEERLRQPGRSRAAYDSEARFLKDIAYGRNREGPLPTSAPREARSTGMNPYPYGSSARPEAPPAPTLDERCAAEEARLRDEQRAEFVKYFRRTHPRASECDAEQAWEAWRRASTIEM